MIEFSLGFCLVQPSMADCGFSAKTVQFLIGIGRVYAPPNRSNLTCLLEQKRTDPCRTSHPMILTRTIPRAYLPPETAGVVASG
ncbi:MAG: hypothetical protein DWI26_05765 [Planctomycetota bacterium]|nr:MAG: hypothetical protein DWI26_05765 [Planctomycetota bacterium]